MHSASATIHSASATIHSVSATTHSVGATIHSAGATVRSAPAPIHSAPAPIQSAPAPTHSAPAPTRSNTAPAHIVTPRRRAAPADTPPALPPASMHSVNSVTFRASVVNSLASARHGGRACLAVLAVDSCGRDEGLSLRGARSATWQSPPLRAEGGGLLRPLRGLAMTAGSLPLPTRPRPSAHINTFRDFRRFRASVVNSPASARHGGRVYLAVFAVLAVESRGEDVRLSARRSNPLPLRPHQHIP